MRVITDELDLKLLTLLQSDARMPATALARKPESGRSRVHKRISRSHPSIVLTIKFDRRVGEAGHSCA